MPSTFLKNPKVKHFTLFCSVLKHIVCTFYGKKELVLLVPKESKLPPEEKNGFCTKIEGPSILLSAKREISFQETEEPNVFWYRYRLHEIRKNMKQDSSVGSAEQKHDSFIIRNAFRLSVKWKKPKDKKPKTVHIYFKKSLNFNAKRNIIYLNRWKGNTIQAKTKTYNRMYHKIFGWKYRKEITKCNKEYYLLKDKEDYLTKVEKQTLIK